jgi:ferric-dicitrate binding protein FerR (iron transport regulator)
MTPSRTSKHALVVVAVCAFAGMACGRGCGEQPLRILATLIEVQGTTVQRDFDAARERWQPAAIGARFTLGDAVRTDAPARASLALADGSKLQMGPGTLIRFLAEGAQDGEQPLSIETGEALLIAGAVDLRLHTQVGMAILQSGSRVRLSGAGRELGYRVEVGSLRFKDASGASVSLHAGDDIHVGIGMAVLKRAAAAAKPAEPEPPSQAAADPSVQAGVEGRGVRARARGSNAWNALDPGEHALLVGTALRLPAGTSVHLARGEDRADLRGAGEFVIGSGSTWIETHSGDVHVTAAAQDIELVVPGGLIIARAGNGGSEADVRIGEGGGLLTVQRGHVTLNAADGSRELSAGDERRFALIAAANAPEGAVEPGPDYANLNVRAGDSFTVHAAEVPVAVGFDVGSRCPHDASIELTGAGSKQRSRGTGRLNLLFQAGTRGYALRCPSAGGPGNVVVRGTVTVMHDAGTRKLPPKAPASSIECDGRSYTIYYQNQLPDISAQWPSAPAAPRYTLDVDGKTMALNKPEHQFKSGSLRDGTHHLTFQAQERRSRTATVEISFDNAAPKASLAAPDDRSFAPGSTVAIEGVALRTWKVGLEGGTIDMDNADRFSGRITTSAEHPDIAVRLTHPTLGTHYYLRRAAGSK